MTLCNATDLLEESGRVAVDEEARPDESLAVSHQIVAKQPGVHTISSPPSDPVSNPDNVSVTLGLFSVGGVSAGGHGRSGTDVIEVRLGPLVHMASNEVSVVADLTLDDVVDVVTAARFWKATYSSHCKKLNYLRENTLLRRRH